MRRPVYRAFLVLAAFLTALSTAHAVPPRTVRLAPRGNPDPLGSVAVIVGLKPTSALAASPETRSAGDVDRIDAADRARRVAAEQAVSAAMAESDFTPTRYFESFPMLAGRASRDGALTLANRPDVAWVVLDGVKHLNATSPSLQPMQLLVRSPRANALGFTGSGQAVAVLDTGVDYTVAELGGAAFPNAKVVGGTNTADNTGDPLDCAGHGTSVAAIIAGAAGIAPDAKIVAVKVFSGCQEFANDSDILAGIDFAIANRSRFSIAAINMSLGADIAGDTSLGFCDSAEPQFASAVNAARTAGMAVVVAAGNAGSSNALSSPACVSGAVSVGAVYSQQIDHVDWGICQDGAIQPDTPTCFSSSNTNLTLLAPGAFWNVVTAGGSLQSFSGTSAAAPAVAGAVAVLKQARPTLTPAGLASLLEATGRPVRTPATGLLTPRIDVFAATQMASTTLVTASGTPVSIPDGTGSATATVTVSGFTGPLGSVQALVSIDHPDPTQLQVTLSGPDGTTVLLHDHSGGLNQPINTVYGLTSASANALTAFEGKTANGVWTLTVSDTVPGTTGRIQAFSLSLVRGQPHVAMPPFSDGFVIPTVARTDTDHLASADLRLYNPLATQNTYQLYFVPKGQTGALAVRSTRTVGAGQVLALNDVLFSEFGYTEASGQLTITANDTHFVATSRSFSDSGATSTSTFIPGLWTALEAGFGLETQALPALTRTTFAHSDVGFTETSGAPATVLFTVTDSNGAWLGSTQQIALPNQSITLSDPIRYLGLGLTPGYRVDASVVSRRGRGTPFAMTTDDISGDTVFEGANTALFGDDSIVTEVDSAASAAGSTQTDVSIANLDSAPVTVTLTLIPRSLTGTDPGPQTYSIPAGQTLTLSDVLLSQFGLSRPSSAALRIHPASLARLAVTARRTLQKTGGGFTSLSPVLTAISAQGLLANYTATVVHMDQDSRTSSSFGLAEVTGSDATVHVSIRSGATGAELGAKDYTIPAGTSVLKNVSDILGATKASNIYFQFSVPSGSGSVVVWGVATDLLSGDAIQVGQQVFPPNPAPGP